MVERAKDNSRIKLHTWLYALYFLLAPMEDLLTGAMGTFGRYLAIIIVLIGALELRGSKIILKLDVKNTCMLMMMLLTVLSLVWSIDKDKTLGRFQPYLLLPSLCLFTSMLCFNEHEFRWITTASIVGGVITAIYTLRMGNTITAYGRTILNEANDPNNLAAHFLLPAALAWENTMCNKGWRRVLFAATFGLFTFTILMTGSRGGFLSLIVIVFSYLLFSRAFKHIYVIVITFILVILLIYFLPSFLPEALQKRMFMVENYTGGGAGRRDLWRTAVQRILPNMGLLGCGAGTSGVKMQEVIGYYKGIHNTYLTLIVEFGLLGIPIFLVMIKSIFSQNFKRKFYIGAAMLAGICVAIFFLDSYAKKFFWNIILFLVIFDQMDNRKKAVQI